MHPKHNCIKTEYYTLVLAQAVQLNNQLQPQTSQNDQPSPTLGYLLNLARQPIQIQQSSMASIVHTTGRLRPCPASSRAQRRRGMVRPVAVAARVVSLEPGPDSAVGPAPLPPRCGSAGLCPSLVASARRPRRAAGPSMRPPVQPGGPCPGHTPVECGPRLCLLVSRQNAPSRTPYPAAVNTRKAEALALPPFGSTTMTEGSSRCSCCICCPLIPQDGKRGNPPGANVASPLPRGGSR